jgi:hypothetical protein
MRRLDRPAVPRVACTALCGSVILFGLTMREVLRTEPWPPSRPSGSPVAVPARRDRPEVSRAQLTATVERDPFHPERRRPGQRFRLPGEADSAAGPPPPATDIPPTLIGTAVLAKGKGFAMCQRGNEPPTLVHVGDRFGDLRLTAVGQGEAVFLTSAGRTLRVSVPKVED